MKALLFGALLVRALNAQGVDDLLSIPDVATTEEAIAPLITPGIDAPSEVDLLSPEAGVEINDAGTAASGDVGFGAQLTPSFDDLGSQVTPIADAIPELPIGTADVIVETPTLDIFGPAETAGVGVADTFDTTGWAWPTADAGLDTGLEATETLTVDNGFEEPATAVDVIFPAATEIAPEGEIGDPSTVIDNVPFDEPNAVPSDIPTEDVPVVDSSGVPSDAPVDDPSTAPSDAPIDDSPTTPSDAPIDDPNAIPADTPVDDVPIDESTGVPSDPDVLGAVATTTDDFSFVPTAASEPILDGETDPLAGVATDDLDLVDVPSATEDPLLSGEPTAPADVVADPGAGVFDATSVDDTFASTTDAAAAAVTDAPTLDLGLGNAATPTLALDFTNFPAVLSDISELIFPTPPMDFNAGASGGARFGGLAASEDPAAPSLDVPLSNDLALPAETPEPLAAAETSEIPVVVDVPISDDLAFATSTSESVVAAEATDVPAEESAVPPQPGVVADLTSTVPTATDSAAALAGPDATPGASSDNPGVNGQSSENPNAQNVQGGSGGFSGEDTGIYDGQDYGEDWDGSARGGDGWGDDRDGGDWETRGKGGKGGKGHHGGSRPHPDLKVCPWWCFEDGNDPGPDAWYDVGPVIKRPLGDRKREEPASGGFESFNYPTAGDNDEPGDVDTADIPEWLWDQSGKRPPRPGPAKQCPWKCYHPRPEPRPTKTRTHHPHHTTRRPWTRTHTWHPWTTTDYPESSTADPTQVTTTFHTKTRHHHSPFTSVLASDIDWTGDTLATICPKTCDPFNPQLNFCDSQTSGCTTTGGKYYCACRAGYRASKWNAKDFSKQFHVPDQPYVYVAPGVVCDKLCGDQLCTEVLTRPHCL